MYVQFKSQMISCYSSSFFLRNLINHAHIYIQCIGLHVTTTQNIASSILLYFLV